MQKEIIYIDCLHCEDNIKKIDLLRDFIFINSLPICITKTQKGYKIFLNEFYTDRIKDDFSYFMNVKNNNIWIGDKLPPYRHIKKQFKDKNLYIQEYKTIKISCRKILEIRKISENRNKFNTLCDMYLNDLFKDWFTISIKKILKEFNFFIDKNC